MQNKVLPIFMKLLLFFALLVPAMNALAQQVTTNSNGEKIVIFDDGSWRYFNPATDAALEKPTSPESVNTSGSLPDMVNSEKSKKVKKAKKKKTKVAKVKKSKKQKVKKPKKAKKAKKGKQAKKEKNKKPKKNKKVKKAKKNKKVKTKKPGKKPKKSKGKKIVKADLTPEMIRQSNALAIRRAERAASTAAKTRRVYEDATLDRVLLEKELQEAYSSLETTDTDIAEIESRLQLVRAKEVIAAKNHEEAEVLAKDYEKMIDMSYYKREKALAKMEAASGTALPGGTSTTSTGNEGENMGVSKAEQKKTEEVKSRLDKMNVILNPPKPPCNLVFNELDEFSGKVRKDVAKELFFTYTNERMRPYFKNREYISCNAGLTSFSAELYFLRLDLEIASEKAQKEYGFLEKGAALIIKMIDGSTIRLLNRKTDTGTLNPLQKSVVYKPQYVISGSQIKDLKKGEVDRVRVIWSTGYEDYEVYELDFFINQLSCLEQK